MKKILYFFASFLALIGAIGSLGYLLWMKQYVIAVGVAVLIDAAYPTVKGWIKALLDE